MALARCDDHKPEQAGDDYLSYANPVGYPDTAATCDVIGCINSARLWLTAEERARFLAGERVFATARGASLRVSDDLFPDYPRTDTRVPFRSGGDFPFRPTPPPEER